MGRLARAGNKGNTKRTELRGPDGRHRNGLDFCRSDIFINMGDIGDGRGHTIRGGTFLSV